jgi:predicted dehydrogenase
VDQIGVACVGAGYWGKNLVRTFHDLPQADLRTCCDLDAERLGDMGTRYPGLSVTQDYDRVLGDDAISAVVLASPATEHYEMARLALESGKHTYVEKPMTLKAADAEDLIRLADSRGLVLMVGHLMEYHPAVNVLKGLVEQGTLGDVYYLYLQRLNLGIIRRDENALWSLGPHDISIALYLLDSDPVSVTAVGQPYLQAGVEDVVFCNLHFSNGAMAHIQVSWLDPNKVRRTTVVGSEKMVVFDDMEPAEKVRIYDKGVVGRDFSSYGEWLTIRSGDITIPKVDTAEPLKIECQHFLDCVRSGEKPRSDGHDGLRVVKVLEAADRSIERHGSPVTLE